MRNRLLIKFLYSIFFFISVISLKAQKIKDKDLSDAQIDLLMALSEAVPAINYEEEGVQSFYQFYDGKKRIQVPGNRTGDKIIDDISLFATLSDLDKLELRYCFTTDFAALKNAKSLKSLKLFEHKSLVGLSSIFEINNLQELIIQDTPEIKDSGIEGIEKLQKLRNVNFDNSKIPNLSPLSKSRSLEKIVVKSILVKEIGDWSKIANLDYVNLLNCGLNNTKFIERSASIRTILLSGNKISNLELPVRNLSALFLNDNTIASINKLSEAKNLKELSISNNQISDIRPLNKLTSLEYLAIDNNKVEDICQLILNSQLETLKISNNPFEDASCLAPLKNLKRFEAEGSNCGPQDLDELRAGVKCDSKDKGISWFLDNIVYVLITIVLLFIIWIFIKRIVT